MVGSLRRWGPAGLAAALGALLLVGGLAVAVGDALLRSDAATAAVTPSAEERRQLEEAGMSDSIEADAGFFRRMMIVQNLSSGGPMPESAYEIYEDEDGVVSMSWGWFQEGISPGSWGGWQLKPVGILSFAGLALILASVFVAAARWESRHPLA